MFLFVAGVTFFYHHNEVGVGCFVFCFLWENGLAQPFNIWLDYTV